jgi:sensor domain CHASE-containing protein
MNQKIIATFLITLVLSYTLLQTFFKKLASDQEQVESQQMRIIHENVRDRFKLFLELPLSIGLIGGDYFSHHNLRKEDYGNNLVNLFKFNKDILGFNIMDPTGQIIRVFPPHQNAGALGKTTQNISPLKFSLKHKEQFWFSAPFQLYQGELGFVLYVPIVSKGELQGWCSLVISTSRFVEKFKLKELIEAYDLNIRDESSGLMYLSTGLPPDNSKKIYESKMNVYGRNLIFQSWKKENAPLSNLPWYISVIVSALLACGGAFMMNLYLEKRRARRQLKDISLLLRMTAKEAISRLIDLQSEFYKLGSTENIIYVTNLIEQIDLLQTMAHTGDGLKHEDCKFFPILQSELKNLEGVLEKKNLTVNFDSEKLNIVVIKANGWLMGTSVVSNILTHALIHAENDSEIAISHSQDNHSNIITFHLQATLGLDAQKSATSLDRRMEVAKKVIELYQGNLILQNDLAGGILIRIILPI